MFGVLFGDEIAVRAGAVNVDVTSPAALFPYLARHLVRTTGVSGTVARLGRMAVAASVTREGAAAVCEVAERLAERVSTDARERVRLHPYYTERA